MTGEWKGGEIETIYQLKATLKRGAIAPRRSKDIRWECSIAGCERKNCGGKAERVKHLMNMMRCVTRQLPHEQEVVDPLSLNLYTYCHNNPAQLTDRWQCSCHNWVWIRWCNRRNCWISRIPGGTAGEQIVNSRNPIFADNDLL